MRGCGTSNVRDFSCDKLVDGWVGYFLCASIVDLLIQYYKSSWMLLVTFVLSFWCGE